MLLGYNRAEQLGSVSVGLIWPFSKALMYFIAVRALLSFSVYSGSPQVLEVIRTKLMENEFGQVCLPFLCPDFINISKH